MFKPVQFFIGIVLGASFSYFFDPKRGKYRRTLGFDKATRYFHDTENLIQHAEKGFRYKSRGIVARLQSRLVQERVPPSDDVLVARIRSKIGRLALHPHSIEVQSQKGNVILRGTAMPYEMPDILTKVKSIRGVRKVKNQIKAPEPVPRPSQQKAA